MSVTEQDRERARQAIGCDCADRAADDASPGAGTDWHFGWCAGDHCDAIAQALADERERARADMQAKIVEATGTHDCPVCNGGRPPSDGVTCPLCDGWTTL